MSHETWLSSKKNFFEAAGSCLDRYLNAVESRLCLYSDCSNPALVTVLPIS